MYNLERYVILVHGISEVKHLMEMAESLIRYMITTAQQEQYEKDQQNIKENLRITWITRMHSSRMHTCCL